MHKKRMTGFAMSNKARSRYLVQYEIILLNKCKKLCAAAIVSRRVSEEGAENDCAGDSPESCLATKMSALNVIKQLP
jgi:hypothetical protein